MTKQCNVTQHHIQHRRQPHTYRHYIFGYQTSLTIRVCIYPGNRDLILQSKKISQHWHAPSKTKAISQVPTLQNAYTFGNYSSFLTAGRKLAPQGHTTTTPCKHTTHTPSIEIPFKNTEQRKQCIYSIQPQCHENTKGNKSSQRLPNTPVCQDQLMPS